MSLELADGPLRAGEVNTFTITGAQPGATIQFFYGREGGGKRISDCDELDAMLQFDDPVMFAEGVADDAGAVEVEIRVPRKAARVKGILLQAADFDNCQESQLVQKAIE